MNVTLVAAAVIPAVILLIQIYRADRLEKEPIGMLLMLAVAGIVSTFLAAVTEQLGDLALSWFIPEGTVLYNIILYFGIVAFAEEGFKYLVLKNRSWTSPHFNCQFDGVVYAVFVSLGFALWENIHYVLAYGFGTAAARAVTAVPGHACFGVFMGAWYGMAKRAEQHGDEQRSRHLRRMSILIPALIHGAYDFIATMESEWLLLIFLVFVIAMFVTALRLVRRMAREDDYIVPQETSPWDSDGSTWRTEAYRQGPADPGPTWYSGTDSRSDEDRYRDYSENGKW